MEKPAVLYSSTFGERGSLSHLNRVCVCGIYSLFFFPTEKKINNLAVGCTDFLLMVEILGVVGENRCPS